MTLGDDDGAVADSQSFMCSNNKDTLYPVYGGDFAMNRYVAFFPVHAVLQRIYEYF